MNEYKQINYDDLSNKLCYLKNLTLVDKAYQFALEKHANQKRKSGDDYINHPLNVAYILSTIHADVSTICAALLHDTNASKDELINNFNLEITELIINVNKINNLNLIANSEAMIAYQRKILVGMTEDVRVIIIKLADKLHNMRTLWALDIKKQKENAKEVLDIFTPIAHRLGINSIKSELEDLSLRYLKQDVYFQIVEKLNKTKTERDECVIEMKKTVSLILNDNSINHEIKGRSKSIYSIYKKLDKGKSFNDIYDLLALRVFVNNEAECYQALGIIHSKFRPIPKRFKDYIAMPKANMYQSLHTSVIGVDGMIFEIQIRTFDMDKVAENGIASHWSYKERSKTDVQNEMEQKLQFFRVIMELKNDGMDDREFVDSIKDEVSREMIYVFTPQGDVIELPKGSTPIDFAYRVHTKVGDTMIGAIVNNNIVPLDYELEDSDVIKINTNKSSTPTYEWINIVKTAQARNKIKNYFNKTIKDDYYAKGEDLLTKELRKRKLANNFINDNLAKILNEVKCSDLNELYVLIGNNRYTAVQIINIVLEENETKEEIILKKTQNKEVTLPNAKGDIIVKGIDNIKVNIASCCKPIFKDSIIGYITKGNGITIHRLSCPNVENLEERFIDVYWNELVSKKYPTSLLIHVIDNKNVLLDIISKTSNTDISIQSVNTLKNGDNFIYDITILVSDLDKLNKYINDINMLSNISSIERLIR